MEKIKEDSQSLKNLKNFLLDTTSNVEGIDTKKVRVSPTKDTINFIKQHNDIIVWEIVGTDFKNKPIYANYIKVKSGELELKYTTKNKLKINEE